MEENKTVVTNENFDWNAFENDLGVYSQPKEEIAAAYDKTLSNVAVGEVVEGTVMSIGKREVVVNIGYKSEGVIPVSEFRYNPELAVGEKVEVYVESAEDKKVLVYAMTASNNPIDDVKLASRTFVRPDER